MAAQDLLCQEILDVLERGVNIIGTDYHSASLQVKEAIIEGGPVFVGDSYQFRTTSLCS